jgi:hypothetical protein
MRAPVSVLLLTAAALLLFISCAAPLRVAGIHTTGRIEDISTADTEAALAAYQASIHPVREKLAEIEVISHDEVRMHYAPAPSSYTAMVREKGKWVKGSVVLVHPIY